MKPDAIELPRRMRGLPLDPRGYPIPFNVYRDPDGRPHFTINDTGTQSRCIAERLCSICGGKLEPRRLWFVGGPMSAFHPHGGYNDPPMHAECARYALRVCPYLALPSYRPGRIEGRTLPADDPHGLIEMTMIEARPMVFVLALAPDCRLSESGTIVPARPWHRIEYWRDGRRIADADGEATARAALAVPLTPADLAPHRIIKLPRR